MKIIVFVLAGLFSIQSQALSQNKISEGIAERLNAIESPDAWKKFVSENKDKFPPISKSTGKTFVAVTKENLDLDGDSCTLGVGYRQAFIDAPPAKVKKILNSPQLFKALYGLDKPAELEIDPKAKPEELTNFKAHIFKKLSIVPDQDYVLEYKNHLSSDLWIQRAKMTKDNENFAIRDSLKTLEEKDGGTVLREVSIVYAIRPWVRFFGPSVREVMKKELAKITEAVKCLAESKEEATEEGAAACWKTAEQMKI